MPHALINNGKFRLNLGKFQSFVINGLIKFRALKALNSITDKAGAKLLTSKNLLRNKPQKLLVCSDIREASHEVIPFILPQTSGGQIKVPAIQIVLIELTIR